MAANPLRLLGVADLVVLAAAAAESPALIATADRIPLTYQDLIRLVDQLAERLVRNGLRSGDRMAIRINSSVEFVVGVLAASRAGIVVVPLDPALPAVELRTRVDAVGARVVLVDSAAPADLPLPCWLISVTMSGSGALLDLDPVAALSPAAAVPDGLQDDDALIMFTGGTTGAPKMVPWNQENIARAIHNITATYQLSPADATVAVMPLYHGHGLIASLLATLASGATLLLPAGGRFSARTFWADIQAARATWYTAVPTIHQILLRHAETDYPGKQQVPLRFMRSCSAAMSPAVAQELQNKFAAPVLCAYGMTEATHQISSMGLSARGVTLSGQVGSPSGVQIRIVADDGQICAPGGVGEVWVRGSTVVRGYLGNPAATDQTFLDGWLRTGDLGSLSAQGEVMLCGRIKEMINRGGEKISPERVEGVLASHPNIVEAAVFGLPDSFYGEIVAAVIVPSSAGAPTLDEITQFCRDRLAAFELPAEIEFANELPHTAKGSVNRRAVVQQFGRQV